MYQNQYLSNNIIKEDIKQCWYIKIIFILSMIIMNIHIIINLSDTVVTISLGDYLVIPIMLILLYFSFKYGWKEVFPNWFGFIILIISMSISSYLGYINPSIVSNDIVAYIVEITKTMTCICYFYIGYNILKVIDIKWVIRLWGIAFSIFIIYGLFASWAATKGLYADIIPVEHKSFFLGFYRDPNHTATYIIVSVFLLLFGINQEKRVAVKVFYYFINLIAIVALILTDSRGGIIAFFISFIIYQIFIYWKKKWMICVSLIAIACITVATIAIDIYVFEGGYTNKFLISISHFWSGLNTRFVLSKAALALGTEFPIWGIGKGNFMLNSEPYLQNNPLAFGQVAHNTYAGIFAELGMIGVVFLLYPLILLLRIIIRTFKLYPLKSEHLRLLHIYLLIICIAIVLGVQGFILNIENRREVWMTLGFLCTLVKYETS